MFKYYFIKTTTLIIYLVTAFYCWWFFLAPVIQLHGVLRPLIVFIGTFIICFLTSAIFFSTRKPMATPSPNNYWRFDV